jgi:hypothetical protein
MAKSPGKTYINTTIDKHLLKSFKILAAKEEKRLNQLLEEAIRELLRKYEQDHPVTFKSLPPKQEKRKHPRTEVFWPVSMITPGGLVQGEIRDISGGGALIHCNELPKADESIELRIDIPDHLLNVSATVEKVRLNIDDGDKARPSYDLAVRFVGVDVDQHRRLHRAIEHQVTKIGPK